jgi:hypothetical protein
MEDDDDQLERNMRRWATGRAAASNVQNNATSATPNGATVTASEVEVSGTIEQTTLVKYGFKCDFEWEDDVRLRF